MGIKETVKTAIQRNKLIFRGDRVLVAVSGGPDSVALVHLLRELQDELGLHLEIAHLDHAIRGEDAKEDARFVAQLAQSLKLPFHLKEIDLPKMKLDAGKGNLEALARAERYRFFAEVMGTRQLGKVATAHTQDDQAETLLLWLLRGTGRKGLGGMAPVQRLRLSAGASPDSIMLVRPLLDISKADVLGYLEERQFAYRIDRTNIDTALMRNWIRRELLPMMQDKAGADLPARLSHAAELLREEDLYLDQLAVKALDASPAPAGLDRTALLSQATALQRRILRLWIEQTRGHLRGLEFVHIEDILRLTKEGPPQCRLSIPGGWDLVREYDLLRVEKRARGKRGVCYDYPFEFGEILRIPEANLQLYSEALSGTEKNPPPANLMEAVFDLESLSDPLRVRNFRHGDRFQPLGMSGRKKIKDLFIEKRVPLSVRSVWPLVTAGDEVLWIPGYGRSALAVTSQTTTAVLHLKAAPI